MHDFEHIFQNRTLFKLIKNRGNHPYLLILKHLIKVAHELIMNNRLMKLSFFSDQFWFG
jgi:hypothetical protein